MSDRDWLYLSGVALTLGVLWYVATHRKSNTCASSPVGYALQANPSEASGTLPVAWCTPMNVVACAASCALAPATPADLTLNIENQGGNLLSCQYIPLFGFVGMAQGAEFQ
jgi:hypothetical protein